MQQLRTFESAEKKVWEDLQRLFSHVRALTARDVASVDQGIELLKNLREQTYEEINQIQHEHMVLCAARHLASNVASKNAEWFWNPRQTGDASEPDLQFRVQGSVVASAEITTSGKPIGVIDSRMASTLEKLSKMPGSRHYFVRSAEMKTRALTKISRAGWNIAVEQLAVASIDSSTEVA